MRRVCVIGVCGNRGPLVISNLIRYTGLSPDEIRVFEPHVDNLFSPLLPLVATGKATLH